MFGAPELGVTRWGTLLVDNKTLMTSLDGVFAAGDIVRGASLVVWAIRDGRDVSTAMHAWLCGACARSNDLLGDRAVTRHESCRRKESGDEDVDHDDADAQAAPVARDRAGHCASCPADRTATRRQLVDPARLSR